MNNLLKRSEEIKTKGLKIIEQLNIISAFESRGAEINLVGSMRTGLILNNYDIDFHVYTEPLSLKESFSIISEISENPSVKEVLFRNLLDQPDQCLEWHLLYEDEDKKMWQIDIIHILKNSPYAGYFETVADRISSVLTQETKNIILSIKNSLNDKEKIPGILIYKSVLEGGVKDIESFNLWMEQNSSHEIVEWMP